MSTIEKERLRVTPRLSRRDLLLGMVGAGGAAALASLGYRQFVTQDVAKDAALAMANMSVPFYGLHQPGIINPAPAAAIFATFDVTAKDRQALEKLLRTLTDRIRFLMQGGTVPKVNDKFPPASSGILGPEVAPDNLTVTVGLGDSLFDQRFGLAALKPKHLSKMTDFPNDALDPSLCHGDLLLQFCANRSDTVIHALRDIIKNTADGMTLRWKIDGALPPETIKKLGQTSVRNMLGFKDGSANLNANDTKLMNEIVWVQAGGEEPTWAAGGTYQVVRVIRNRVEFWDRTPLQEQEKIIGRSRDSGAPLGQQREEEIPNFAKDPKDQTIPLDAHIRLANPHTPESRSSLILRRGYNYSRGYDKSGHLDMGLLFACFQSNLDKGFITVQNRLKDEPLVEYIKPIGGGYFFTLPGVQNAQQYLGQSLLEVASRK